MPKTAVERTQSILTRRKLLKDEHTKLWIRNARRPCQIWEVPVDALVLNVENRRFTAEKLLAQELLGRDIDPENNPEDDRTIESLLLDTAHRAVNGQMEGTPSKNYLALRTDWETRGQESPLWIRPDGTVRNGNRRLAMIKRTQREKGDTGLQWVEAVILDPEEIDEAALLEMEQREQLTENFKVRYNDIDYLLALREAADNREVDWFLAESIDDVAGKLQSTVQKTKQEVLRDLYAIKYMDLFLEDTEQPGQYHRLLRTLEIFRDIGRMMITVESDYMDDYDRVLQVLFAAVKARKQYPDIRYLRRMFRRDRSRFDKLAEEIVSIESALQQDKKPKLMSPAGTASDDADDDASDTEAGPTVINYPPAVGRIIDVAIDGYQASQESDAVKILREVVNRLESLTVGDRLNVAFEDKQHRKDTQAVLAQVVAWVDQHRDLVSNDD